MQMKPGASYAILYIADFEKGMLERFEKKPMIWWRCIDDIFFNCKHGKESL